LIDFVKFFEEYIRARKRQAGLVVLETNVRLVIINTKLKGVSRLEGPLNPTVLAEQSSVGVIGLITLKSPYGVVELSDNGLVKGFLENSNSTTGSTQASTTSSQRSSNTCLKKSTSKRQRN
jgi:hypothetical protein